MSSVPLVNACYFFNRVEGDDVKYVSYHFIEKLTIVERFAETRRILLELSAVDGCAALADRHGLHTVHERPSA